MNHHIGIDASDPNDAPRLVLVCTATPGSDCRKRPTDGRETWQFDDPDLIDGECWAAEWIDAAGWDDSVRADAALDGTPWPRIPVTVHYDEGVIVAPTPPRYEAPDVAELRRLMDAATQRPWSTVSGAGNVWHFPEEGTPTVVAGRQRAPRVPDALLIAAAVNALPDLLDAAAEVERLTGQIEAAKRICLGTHLGRPWHAVLDDVLRALDGAES